MRQIIGKCLPSPRRLCVTVGSVTCPGLVLMLQLLHLRLQFGDYSEGGQTETHMVTRFKDTKTLSVVFYFIKG